MSFFVKSKGKAGKANGFSKNKKQPDTSRKRKTAPAKPSEDVTSSEDEENFKTTIPDVSSSEDENETPQDKKLRLAKIYLREIEREEQRRLEDADQTTSTHSDPVTKRLKLDYLEQMGKLKSFVADKCKGAKLDAIETRRAKEHKNCLTHIFLTQDNQFLFSGSKDGSIVKWNLEGRKRISSIPFCKTSDTTTVKGHSSSITSLAVSSDNQFLAVSDRSAHIQIWSGITLNHLHTFCGHQRPVTGVTFKMHRGTVTTTTTTEHTLYTCSDDRTVKVWRLSAGPDFAYVETLHGHRDAVTGVDVLPAAGGRADGDRVVSAGGREGTVRVWQVAEESQLVFGAGHEGSVDIVRCVSGGHFVSGGDDGALCLWSALKKKPLCVVKEAHGLDPTNSQPNWIISITSLINTDLFASGSCDGHIRLWKLGENYRTITALCQIPMVGFVNSLQIMKDGSHVVAAIGSEHRSGRWSVIKSAKNALVFIPLDMTK